MPEYRVPIERFPKQVVAALNCVSGCVPDAPVVSAMQVGQGRSPTVPTLVEDVERMSLPGLMEGVMHSIHGMENADEIMWTRYPCENRGSVMDPDEGIDMVLLHFFLDHVMPPLGWGRHGPLSKRILIAAGRFALMIFMGRIPC